MFDKILSDISLYLFDPLIENAKYLINELPIYIYNFIILIIGLILGKILYIFVSSLLRNIKFDLLAEKLGINLALEKVTKDIPSRVVGRLVYWIVVILFISVIIKNFGLSGDIERELWALIKLFTRIFSFFSFILIGYYIALFVSKFFNIFLSFIGFDFPKILQAIFLIFALYGTVYYAYPILNLSPDNFISGTFFILKALVIACAIGLIFSLIQLFKSLYNYLIAKKYFKIGNIIQFKGDKYTINKISFYYIYVLTHTEEKIITIKSLLKHNIISR